MNPIKLFFLSILMLLFFSTEGQVTEQAKTMSLGTQNALIVGVPDADERTIERQWKDYLGEYGRVRRNRKAGEYYADDIKIPSISGAGTLDVYSWAKDGQLITFFDMGNGFLSSESHPSDYRNAVVFLNEFKYHVQRYIINEELEEQEDELDDLKDQLERLKKNNDDYHEDIEEAKEAIAEAEANIEQNVVDQKNKKKEIEGQKNVIEEIRNRLENVGKK
ncbi:MAG: hypothetical protein R3275_02360 [Saprospiraceae bacterium]|nr:hypothetical protein [Saprospiraceae bacterium]